MGWVRVMDDDVLPNLITFGAVCAVVGAVLALLIPVAWRWLMASAAVCT